MKIKGLLVVSGVLVLVGFPITSHSIAVAARAAPVSMARPVTVRPPSTTTSPAKSSFRDSGVHTPTPVVPMVVVPTHTKEEEKTKPPRTPTSGSTAGR